MVIKKKTKSFSKTKLKHVKSNKGINSISSGAGVISGKKAANKADDEGKSDIEIIKEAKKAGKEAGKKAGTAVGVTLAALSTRKSIKGIDKAVKWAQKNSEQASKYTTVGRWLGKLGENAAYLIKSPRDAKRITGKIAKWTEKGDKAMKHISKNALKYGEIGKIGVIGLSVLTPLSFRALGKRRGERAAEKNTVARLENRHNIDTDKK